MGTHARRSVFGSSLVAVAGNVCGPSMSGDDEEESLDDYAARMLKAYSSQEALQAVRNKPAAYRYTRKASYSSNTP